MKNAREEGTPAAGRNAPMPGRAQAARSKPESERLLPGDRFLYFRAYVETLPEPLKEMVTQQIEFFSSTAKKFPEEKSTEENKKKARDAIARLQSLRASVIGPEIEKFRDGTYSEKKDNIKYADALARICFGWYYASVLDKMYPIVIEKDRDNLTFVFHKSVDAFCSLLSSNFINTENRVINFNFWTSGAAALIAACATETGTQLLPPSMAYMVALNDIAKMIPRPNGQSA